jgi:hypothetical protein
VKANIFGAETEGFFPDSRGGKNLFILNVLTN